MNKWAGEESAHLILCHLLEVTQAASVTPAKRMKGKMRGEATCWNRDYRK